MQVLWVVAVVVRWRQASGHVRVQLAVLGVAAALSAVALAGGLVVDQSPRAGVLAAALIPIAAGWAVLHGQHLAAYSALSWLSQAGGSADDLPADLARAVGRALGARSATLWVGDDELFAVGVWPETDERIEPTTPAGLLATPSRPARIVQRDGCMIGALSVERSVDEPLSLAEQRLYDDLVAQARFVIEHIGLADLQDGGRTARRLDALTPREQEVLELMARGRSNSAICAELHLSIKTVEPVVSSIFTKLGLHADSASNRRVLAVLTYLRA